MTTPYQPGMFANTLAEVGAAPAAPYGQFTGYQPLPGVPNGYEFDLASGGKRKLVGPAAQDLAGKLDAARGLQSGVAPAGPVGGPAPAAAQPNDWLPYKTSEGGHQILLRKGGDPSNPLDLREIVPGRAATKGGLALRSQTERGGYELDPERVAEVEKSQEEVQSVQRDAAKEARAAMAQRQATFDAMRAQASNEAAVMAHENTIKQQRLDALSAKYDAAEKDFLATPDKQKAAREGDKVKTVVEALSSALGALGAGLARTPNFAAQIIESNREREMRREEAELRVKKEVGDSLLGRLRDDMGSMELAKTAYRAIRSRQDALTLEQQAAKTDDAQRAQTLTLLAAKEHEKSAMWREELERGKQGEVTKQLVNTPGSSGSAGGVRSVQGKDVDKPKEGQLAKPPSPVDFVTSNTTAESANVIGLANSILQNPALRDADSEFFGPSGSIKGKLPAGEAISSADENRLRQDLQNYKNARIKEMTGAGMGVEEAQRLMAAEVGSGSANDIKRGVAKGALTALRRTRSNLATQDPRNRDALLKQMDPYTRAMVERGEAK